MPTGWIEACAAADLKAADVIRFDHGKKTYALYRTQEGALYATDGLCTHGNVHLSKGLVKGDIIECSKHNGRFHLIDGSPARVPICRGLATYPIEERNGRIFINVTRPGGAGARPLKTYQLRVVSNANVATFIKELVLEPLDAREKIAFTPGRLSATRHSRRTKRSAFASSIFRSLSLRYGSASIFLTWWRTIPRLENETIIPWPATSRRIVCCASMCVLPRRRPARIVLPGLVPATCSASSREISLLPSDRSGTSISSPRSER